MEFIELCQHLSNEFVNQKQNQSLNLSLNITILSSLVIGYTLLSIITKKPYFLMAFLLCVFLQSSTLFQVIDYAVIYLLVCVIYSYIFVLCFTRLNKLACVIIIFLSLVLYTDAALYGNNGIYGTHQTIVYEVGDYFSLFAHFFFICTFVNFTKIRNNILDFIGSITALSRSVYYMFVYWYNVR